MAEKNTCLICLDLDGIITLCAKCKFKYCNSCVKKINNKCCICYRVDTIQYNNTFLSNVYNYFQFIYRYYSNDDVYITNNNNFDNIFDDIYFDNNIYRINNYDNYDNNHNNSYTITTYSSIFGSIILCGLFGTALIFSGLFFINFVLKFADFTLKLVFANTISCCYI